MFSWMPAGNQNYGDCCRERCRVSILVLVDACRKLCRTHDCVSRSHGFNPCSRGCLPETHAPVIGRGDWWCFNPCSRGCLPETPMILFGMTRRRPSFNPCSRGCLPETSLPTSQFPFLIGFNPCSRGCLPETVVHSNSLRSGKTFQSLFSWMPAGNTSPFLPVPP